MRNAISFPALLQTPHPAPFVRLAGPFGCLPARRSFCFLLQSEKKQYNILDFIFMRKKQLLF